MDFKDWRLSAQNASARDQGAAKNRFHGKRFSDHIEEQLREAEERGAFQNLPGMGQPLKLDAEASLYAGDKALGYSLLKKNGHLPAELEMVREIDRELERLESLRARLIRRGRELRRRAVRPFPSEKRAYNAALENALAAYKAGLHELNRKILTLNLSTPASLHRAPLDDASMVDAFRMECPPLK